MNDQVKDNFEITLKKIGAINQPKALFKMGKFLDEFTANGTKYFVMPADKVFNIDRQVAYHNIETAFALTKHQQL